MGSTRKRVFHGLYNIAGIPAILAEAERALGVDSRSMCFSSGVYQRQVDEVIDGFSVGLLSRAAREFDVFNFHFGSSFLGGNLRDLPLLRAMGKKVFMHFHGCDVRDSREVIEKYAISACMECWPMQCSANRGRARTMAQRHADKTFVSTPDIVEFVKGSEWLPQAIDTAGLMELIKDAPPYRPDPTIVRVAHAPSSKDLKGSRFLEKAVAALRDSGVPIELVLLTNMTHKQVIQAMYACDVVVDQLLIGAYGVVAVEAMLLSKPVMVYIRPDLLPLYGEGLSVVNASPVDLVEKLRWVVDNRDQWSALAARGRAFAEVTHDKARIAARLSAHY